MNGTRTDGAQICASSRHQFGLAIASIVLISVVGGCQAWQINTLSDRLQPSNERDWTAEMQVLPFAEFEDDKIHLKNIRNINYLSEFDFVVKHYDRTIELEEIRGVDFVVSPFLQTPLLAHTMLSFELSDGNYLGVSVEVRKEQGESYSPFAGAANQFEIMYVVADERDLIRLRTRHRNADVYVYPTIATPEQAQALFVQMMQRVNQLKVDPEFYGTLRNNCTTNLVQHVNQLKRDKVRFNWRVLLPGFSAEYAYDIGLLDNQIPFEDLKALAHINDLADRYHDSPEFSQLIRSDRMKIQRLVDRQKRRQPTLESRGAAYLDDQFPRSSRWR